MCGIAGLIKTDRSREPRILEHALHRATAALKPRGPDDRGVWINPEGRVGLAHTRLSILDLSPSGHQPMRHPNGSALTYNGEIYNYEDLRASLSARTPFQGSSDTEVLLHVLAESGLKSLTTLDGMFAFSYYDAASKQMLLAVDPAGEKPLYTYWDGGTFAFASEIKGLVALLESEGDFTLDAEAFGDSLIFGYVPSPRTIYRFISKLPAGHFLIVDEVSGPRPSEAYWDVPLGQVKCGSFRQAKADLRDHLHQAVKKRLRSDVPLGSFLSGGLDSSAVSLEAARCLGAVPLKTFAATYRNSARVYDESAFAKTVAARIGSDHREVEIPTTGFDAESIIRYFDEPFGDSSAIPTFHLCAQTRAHVKVALTGDGGDELFGGYLRFRAALISERHKTLWNLLLNPFKNLPARPFSWLSRAQRFHSALGRPLMERLALWNSFFSERDLEVFLNQKFDRLSHQIARFDEKTRGLSLGEKILYYNFKTYLFDDLLPKVDRMSMAHGLELRAPFLDKALIEFAFRLPTEFKFNAFQTKIILKSAYDQDLGKDITRRKKHGFAYPIDAFLRSKPERSLESLSRLFPRAKLELASLSPQNLSSKKFMLWSLEHLNAGKLDAH